MSLVIGDLEPVPQPTVRRVADRLGWRTKVSAFAELDWRRIDVSAIVACSGLATIEEERHPPCREWLVREGYQMDTLDCRGGLEVAVPALGRLLRWEAQFGYPLGPTHRNLDALRDGFHFDLPAGGARLFEMLRPDVLWKEDPRWLCGLLAIIQEHTRYQLALGNRFFALLVVPAGSPLIGATIEHSVVPGPHWHPGKGCGGRHE